MNREVVGELISVARLDTTAATKEARAWADRLRAVEAETRRVADANKFTGASASTLRGEMLRLRKEEAAGTIDKKSLAQQTKLLRISMAEQTEQARKLKDETKRLRDEERSLQAEMKQTAKAAADAAKTRMHAAKETAKAEAAAAKAASKALTEEARNRVKETRAAAQAEIRAVKEAAATRDAIPRLRDRNSQMAQRERDNWRKMQASGERINGLNDSLSAGDRRLMQLQRPMGGIRTAIGDRIEGTRGSLRGIADDPGAFASAAGSRAATGMGGIVRGAAGLAMGGAAAVAGIGGAVASKGADFEALRASLETVEGSAEKAASTFKLIQTFAAQTPYGVEETTNSLLKLKSRGLDASLPSLKAYGDTASAMGKSLDMMVEAVADATTGEFERLKEFGIKAKTEGDNVKLTFKGVTTTVAKDAKSIEGYLVNLGKTNFAGGMERQSRTLKGMMSSLGDSVSQVADVAFQNGLGSALKEIVTDLMGASGSGEEFAKVLGRTLGDAARGAYKFIKEMIGPIDELPGKLQSAADFVGTVASGLKTLAGMATTMVGAVGPANAAFVAMGIAATAALGPVGLLAVGGVALAEAFMYVRDNAFGATGAIEKFKQQQKEIEESDRRNIETRKLQEGNSRREASNALLDERSNADKAAQERFKAARLRTLGKDESQLTPAERRKLANDAAIAGFNVSMAGKGGAGEAARAAEGILGGEERSADAAEIGWLKGKKNKSPSEKKRLAALTKQYDLETGKTGAGKKTKDDAFDEDRKKEINDLVAKAEREAGDQALASGNAAGASEAARNAGKSTRARLEEQARKGALPGEVERSLLRVAGFEDVKNAPPPPVIVTNIGPVTFTVHVPLELSVQTNDNPESIAQDVATHIDTILERDVLPKAANSLFTSLKR